MAINRVGLVTGETGSQNEYIAMGGSNADISSAVVHTGNYAIRFNNQFSSRTIAMGLPLVANLRSNYFLYHTAGPTGDYAILFLVHSAGQTNYEIDIRWYNSTEAIHMHVNGVEVGIVSAAVAGLAVTNTWIPVGIHLESGITGKIILYIDGIEVLRYEGLIKDDFDYITACGTWPTGLIPSGWFLAYLDDWYTDELTLGDIEEQSPPSPRWMYAEVENRMSVEWTPVGDVNNDECVDDIGLHDGDATYVFTTQSGDIDIYSVSDILLPTNYVIDAVVPFAVARKTDAGLDGRLRFFAYNGVTESDGGQPFLPVSYRPVYGRIPLQPNGSRWTQGSFNGMGFGFESVGEFE